MPSPTLAELPAPSPGKTGWPWTVESARVLGCMADGRTWPRITIVTPTFNQGHYIEETIRSVLLQGYPDLEYIVIDGGSTDDTLAILRKYEKHLAFWVSKKDRGQSHAINKGMERATGDIRAYINSDDLYLPGALDAVAESARARPDADLIHGRCRIVDEHGETRGERAGRIDRYDEILDLWSVWWQRRNFVQPEVFWTRRIAEKAGQFSEDLYWVMDYDYWLRILHAGGRVATVNAELAAFRLQPGQKSTQPDRTAAELRNVVQPYIFANDDRLSRSRRLQLQGQWLLDTVFREQVAHSVGAGEQTWRRRLKLAKLALRHPQLLAVPMFRQRALSVVMPSRR